MRNWLTLSVALALWPESGVLFGQIQPCPGGGENPYLTSAPRPIRREGVPSQLFRPATMVEIGARVVTGDRASAKFLEYREIPRGIFIENLTSCSETPGSGFYYRLRSQETAEMDQHSWLTAGIAGRLKITTAWDRTLHTLSTEGRNHFARTASGEFTLPQGIQALQNVLPVNLLFKRNTARVGVTVTPSEAWDLRMEYSRENRTGSQPTGANFGFRSVVELPEPIDYRTHNLRLISEFARPTWLVQIESRTSLFDNSVGSLEWTNPFQEPTGNASPARGRKSLPPSNAAQTFSLAGAADLPHSVRIVATLSPGWMTQDEAFLPFTSNVSLQERPDFPVLPASNLDGRKGTLMMNYLVAGRAGKQFAYNARYRSYELNNETPSLVSSNYVRYDSLLPSSSPFNPQARRSLPYGYRKQNVNLDWIWEPNQITSAKVFYEWEGWDREHREVSRSNEHTVGASWDLSREGPVQVLASFQHSRRLPRRYDSESFNASFPNGPPLFELPQLAGLRRFDQAERSRNYGELLIEATPTELLSVSTTYTVDRSFFEGPGYGLLHDHYQAVSFNAAYILTPSISVFGDYTYERSRYAQRSRERLSASLGFPENDSANNNWESKLRDRTHTWGAGVNGSFLNNRVIADVYWSLSHSQSSTATKALGNPSMAGFLADTAEDYPDTSDRFQQWVVAVRIPLGQSVSQKLQYTHERFTERDLALEQAAPFPGLPGSGGAASMFLGPLLARYRVHTLSYSLSFVF